MKLTVLRTVSAVCMYAVLTAGIVSTACAFELIDQFDKNQDGMVSMDEFHGPDEVFTKIDSDGDGFISEAEAANAPAPPRGGKDFIERFDQNGDGLVAQDECSLPEEAFSMQDTDGDGFISEAEADHVPPPPPDGRQPSDARQPKY